MRTQCGSGSTALFIIGDCDANSRTQCVGSIRVDTQLFARYGIIISGPDLIYNIASMHCND